MKDEVAMIARVTHFLAIAALLFSMLVSAGCAVKQSAGTIPSEPEQAETQDRLDSKSSGTLFRAKPSWEPLSEYEAAAAYVDPNSSTVLSKTKIVISKKARLLKLFSGKMLVREYPIKIGINPDGDKEKQGDGRTPEGTFYICVKNPQSKYHLSLGLSYPDVEDAERGRRHKLITEEQYERIVKRISNGKTPPWDTPLGGEIFIHGEAEIWDWTYGCVAMNNSDIEELYRIVPVGTTVVITE